MITSSVINLICHLKVISTLRTFWTGLPSLELTRTAAVCSRAFTLVPLASWQPAAAQPAVRLACPTRATAPAQDQIPRSSAWTTRALKRGCPPRAYCPCRRHGRPWQTASPSSTCSSTRSPRMPSFLSSTSCSGGQTASPVVRTRLLPTPLIFPQMWCKYIRCVATS